MSEPTLHELLYGEECPECGSTIEPGSVRYAGYGWEHKDPNVHPQAGHHQFDVVEAIDGEVVSSFTPEVCRGSLEDQVELRGHLTVKLAGTEGAEDV